MKNFRKVLALVLVVATLFSFVAMASAKDATEYKDYAEINYDEAVGVLSAIGINEGHDTGYFAPQDPIDRDEVAAMVARLRNGGTLNADLYVGADKVFADVKGQWSEGYVTYAAQLGIIAGRNDSTFDPDADVTGVETMKMLLCVLGYDPAIQGYTGANWQVNVVRDAKKAGLLIDGVDPYKPATREQVAQYFLNALKAYMVIGYLGEGIVKVTNSIWAEGRFDLGVVTPDAIPAEYELTYKNAMISGDQLVESIPGLEYKGIVGEDCYRRPAAVWTYGSWTGIYPIAPTEKWVSASYEDIADTVDVSKASAVYVNGYTVGKSTADKLGYDYHTGNGVVVEYFADQNVVVVIDTFIGVVAEVSEYRDTFEIQDKNTKTLVTAASLKGYDVAEGDMVLYWLCNADIDADEDGLHAAKVVEPINANVTEGDIYAGNYENPETCFVAGGKTYNYAWNLGNAYDPSIGALYMEHVYNNNNFDIYVDENGFVMYLAPHEEASVVSYAYVVEGTAWKGNYSETVGTPSWDYTASMVKFADKDGALKVEEDVAINAELYKDATLRFNGETGIVTNHIGTLVELVDGEYADKEATYASKGTMLSEGSWVLKEGEIYATSKTVFMIRTLNLDGTYSYEQVTGYDNLDGTYIAETVVWKGQEIGTNIQYFANNGFATVVFIDAKAQVAEADHFLVLEPVNYMRFEYALKAVYANDYLVYDAIVDGERAVVASHVWMNPGNMYSDLLTFRGFVATVGGEKLPLYVYVDFDHAAIVDVLNFEYIVAEDEIYIGYETKDGIDVVKKLAADAKIFVIEKVDGEVVATEKLYKEMIEDDDYIWSYIYLEGNEIVEFYVLADSFF